MMCFTNYRSLTSAFVPLQKHENISKDSEEQKMRKKCTQMPSASNHFGFCQVLFLSNSLHAHYHVHANNLPNSALLWSRALILYSALVEQLSQMQHQLWQWDKLQPGHYCQWSAVADAWTQKKMHKWLTLSDKWHPVSSSSNEHLHGDYWWKQKIKWHGNDMFKVLAEYRPLDTSTGEFLDRQNVYNDYTTPSWNTKTDFTES